MHGIVYYQCDWTGHPMRNTNCYMPAWNDSGKLIKRGSYINWESVVAHAEHLASDGTILDQELQKIREHVTGIIGPLPETVAHFTWLEHFFHTSPGSLNVSCPAWTVERYHEECCKYQEPINALKITQGNETVEVIITPTEGKYNFEDYLTRPYMAGKEVEISSFVSMRRGKMPKDVSVKVFYWPEKNGLDRNQLASNYFKMEMYGDVILVKQRKETAAWPRERYTSLSYQQFDDVFSKKRKKSLEEDSALSSDEFNSVKQQMQASFDVVEKQISSTSQKPGDLVRGAKMPAPTAQEMKAVAMLKGLQPPTLCRQAAVMEG